MQFDNIGVIYFKKVLDLPISFLGDGRGIKCIAYFFKCSDGASFLVLDLPNLSVAALSYFFEDLKGLENFIVNSIKHFFFH